MFKLLLVVACIAGSQAGQYNNHYDRHDHIDDLPEGETEFDNQFDQIQEENGHKVYVNSNINHQDHLDHVEDLPEGDNAFDDQFDQIQEEDYPNVHDKLPISLQKKFSSRFASDIHDQGNGGIYAPIINYAQGHGVNKPAMYGSHVLVDAPAVYASHVHAFPAVYANTYGHDSQAAYGHDSQATYGHDIQATYGHDSQDTYGHDSQVSYSHDATTAHGLDTLAVYGHDNVHDYGTHGMQGYGSGYRFSGLHSPVTAGHYIGYGNKYQFRYFKKKIGTFLLVHVPSPFSMYEMQITNFLIFLTNAIGESTLCFKLSHSCV